MLNPFCPFLSVFGSSSYRSARLCQQTHVKKNCWNNTEAIWWSSETFQKIIYTFNHQQERAGHGGALQKAQSHSSGVSLIISLPPKKNPKMKTRRNLLWRGDEENEKQFEHVQRDRSSLLFSLLSSPFFFLPNIKNQKKETRDMSKCIFFLSFSRVAF